MEKMGAEIIHLENIVSGTPFTDSRTIMAYEFKDGINKYLNDLGETKPANDLSDLIRLTYSDSIEMKYFNLLRMENSNSKGDLSNEEYTLALSEVQKITVKMELIRLWTKIYWTQSFVQQAALRGKLI